MRRIHVFDEIFCGFPAKKNLEIMRPFERFATAFEPVQHSYFQHAAKYNISGSDGQSIIMHGGLRKYLSNRDLIQQGWNGRIYHFSSINDGELSLLGIKYVLANQLHPNPSAYDDRYIHHDNQVIWTNQGRGYLTCLYENKRDVSVGYLTSGSERHYIHDLDLAVTAFTSTCLN